MKLTGQSTLAGRLVAGSGPSFHGIRADSGEALEPAYRSVGLNEVDAAAQAAHDAFQSYGRSSGKTRGAFLRAMATRIDSIMEDLVARTPLETGLPEPRVRAETARTTGQLRMFAGLVEEGSWVDARIDHGDPSRQPFPKPDMRSMLRPVGPVAVFGAANFPLAYSVAGGDTASALAAGCPVIVKAHPAHPGTSELVGQAVMTAANEHGLPPGAFSLLFDSGYDVGRALVAHPLVTAVGFTGSRAGGLALAQVAATRHAPIPIFAEMSSVNPVFLLPGALKSHADTIAQQLHVSVNQGVGQMCTCPGLVIAERSSALDELIKSLAARMATTAPAVMLNSSIAQSYEAGLSRLAGKSKVKRLTSPESQASLWRVSGTDFTKDQSLMAEVFGPSTLVVECESPQEMLNVANGLEGQLTASVHGEPYDWDAYRNLLELLESKAGRLIINGVPTGLEVGPATVHGGPFPATSDGRTTAVGTRSILRFTRAMCFQGHPDHLLPEELRESNPLGIRRLVDGTLVLPR